MESTSSYPIESVSTDSTPFRLFSSYYCNSTCKELLWIEVGLGSVPSILFLILATVRFYQIKSIGFASRITVYTKFFLTKRVLSFTMAVLYLSVMIITLSLPYSYAGQNISWFLDFERKGASCCYLLNAFAWLVCERLLRYEYRKRLSEALYAEQLFWILSLIVEIVCLSLFFESAVTYLHFIYNQGVLNDLFSAFELTANFILVIMMLLTTKRTTENPRPDLYFIPDLLEVRRDIFDEDSESAKSSNFLGKMSFHQEQGQYLTVEIKMGKRILELEGKPVFEFVVRIKERNHEMKVLKTYGELHSLEEYIHGEYTHTRYPSFIKKSTKLPRLERDLNSSQMSNMTGSTGSAVSVTVQTEKFFLKKVNNIEKFLKTIAKHKIYHCRQILDFLKIPSDIQSELLEERSQYLELKRPRWQSSLSSDQYEKYRTDRAQSYAGVSELEIEEEKVEEYPPNYKVIDDYMGFEGKGEGRRVPFEVAIPSYQLSNQGEFYEFVIEVQYKEGDGARWTIFKRYSEFVDLHQSLQQFFARIREKDAGFRTPNLPPQIQKQNELALNQRKQQLEGYLRSIVMIGEVCPVFLEFLEFGNSPQMGKLGNISEKRIKISETQVKIVNQKPKTFFVITVANIGQLTPTAKQSSAKKSVKDAHKSQTVKILKQYKEFKELHETLKKTFSTDEENFNLLPEFPDKYNEVGSEIATDVLQQQLDTYLNTLLRTRAFDSLICIQTFFSEGIQEATPHQTEKSSMRLGGTMFSQSPLNQGKERDTTPINFDPTDDDSEEEENSPFRVSLR